MDRVTPYRAKMNNPYTAGIWDWWYSGARADLWVEWKHIAIPKRDNTLIVPALSELQRHWGRGRHAEGRNLAVLVGCKQGGVVFRDLEWEVGITTEQFRARLLSRAQLGSWITSNVS